MPKVLEITGLTELEDWLDRAPKVALRELETAMTRATLLVKADLAQYPPATASNQPGRFSLRTKRPMGYYERGHGWWYPVMRKTTLPAQLGKTRGAVRASKFVRQSSGVAGYKLAGGGESEVLGKSWTTEVRVEETAVVGVLGNDTSYIDYVQGGRQTRLHQAHGWGTIEQALDRDEDAILDEFAAAIDRIVADFGKDQP